MKDIKFHNSKMLDETATLRYYIYYAKMCGTQCEEPRRKG